MKVLETAGTNAQARIEQAAKGTALGSKAQDLVAKEAARLYKKRQQTIGRLELALAELKASVKFASEKQTAEWLTGLVVASLNSTEAQSEASLGIQADASGALSWKKMSVSDLLRYYLPKKNRKELRAQLVESGTADSELELTQLVDSIRLISKTR